MVDYYELLVKVLKNMAWEHGSEVLEDLLIDSAYIELCQNELEELKEIIQAEVATDTNLV